MIQVPAWLLFVIGVAFGILVGFGITVVIALNYKGDKDASKKDKV